MKMVKPLVFERIKKIHLSGILIIFSALLYSLVGCAVKFENTQPARELAQLSQASGSVYLGWQAFQGKCAACHGASGMGGNGGPNLLPIMQEMGPRQFASLVLKRYDWNHSVDKAKKDSASREVLIEDILQGKEPPIVMPAWQGNPSVNLHILDLYAYLSARAQGVQGPDRPKP